MDKNKKNKILIFLFTIYCLLLIWIILFKLSFSILNMPYLRKLILIPFPHGFEHNFLIREMAVNVIMFVPFGVYLKMLKISNKKIIFFGFLTSTVFECLQYFFAIGVSDTTDIITNTLGTIIGVFSYLFVCKTFKNREKVDKVIQILAILVTILAIILLPFYDY